MYTDSEYIKKLSRLCLTWGGKLIRKDEDFIGFSGMGTEDGSGIYDAPFTQDLAIDYKNKIIYYNKVSQWTGIIHEMGHTFACVVPPDESDEVQFFGWEYCLAKTIGGEQGWIKANDSYVINHPSDHENFLLEFKCFTKEEKQEIIDHWIAVGHNSKIIIDMKPVAIR